MKYKWKKSREMEGYVGRREKWQQQIRWRARERTVVITVTVGERQDKERIARKITVKSSGEIAKR